MEFDGKPHPHSFLRDGSETRNCEAVATEGNGISIRSAIAGLLVLKSTGSGFNGFIQDEFTILPETYDRILSTEVDAGWTWSSFDDVKAVGDAVPHFDKAWNSARDITLRTFADDESPSVQNTMFKMAHQILNAEKGIEAVDYSLPNKHYFEIGKLQLCMIYSTLGKANNTSSSDLSWHKGLKNTGKDAEVYAPQTSPNGIIQCTVRRDGQGIPSRVNGTA